MGAGARFSAWSKNCRLGWGSKHEQVMRHTEKQLKKGMYVILPNELTSDIPWWWVLSSMIIHPFNSILILHFDPRIRSVQGKIYRTSWSLQIFASTKSLKHHETSNSHAARSTSYCSVIGWCRDGAMLRHWTNPRSRGILGYMTKISDNIYGLLRFWSFNWTLICIGIHISTKY